MTLLALLGIAVGLSMDAFAVALSNGCTIDRLRARHFRLPISFAIFQALMPLAGFWLGTSFRGAIQKWDGWIAFAVLSVLGVKMLVQAVRELRRKGCIDIEFAALPFGRVLSLSLATSLDAFAIGVGFSVLGTPIGLAMLIIGFTTLALSSAGMTIGHMLKAAIGGYAEILGGLILLVIGARILSAHLGGP